MSLTVPMAIRGVAQKAAWRHIRRWLLTSARPMDLLAVDSSVFPVNYNGNGKSSKISNILYTYLCSPE